MKSNDMSFSERYGYKPVRETLQIESIDEALRNGVWNCLKVSYWDTVKHTDDGSPWGPVYDLNESRNAPMKSLCVSLWELYFKEPLDGLSNDWGKVRKRLKESFFACEWDRVYDFIEFTARNYPNDTVNRKFMSACNTLFEREVSAYRFVGGKITRITEAQEIEAIEEATQGDNEPILAHLRRALELLSDRTNPDYRNSIKESISAVESICNQISGKKNASLKEPLRMMRENHGLHPALEEAFNKLYAYTCDDGGIRHALMDKPNPGFDDAKFMLVICSAFVNYVRAKRREEGSGATGPVL